MAENEAKGISAGEFALLQKSDITIVDVREPDEVLIHEIDGAVNLPLSSFPKGLDDLVQDKPVYVICRTGDFSEQVAEILAERGYEAYNVEGGFQAYRSFIEKDRKSDSAAVAGSAGNLKSSAKKGEGTVHEIDAKGLKCPGPIVKVADTLRDLSDGDIVHVEATEDAFASDIRIWCERTGNGLLKLDVTEKKIEALIVKKSVKQASGASDIPHGKNFVVFSGDLDKTIAAFIMANGSAAMGREVTMFFTFWGLNILRRPNKVRVKKTFIEKMFGIMMPRGTYKLGLSRMNMGGIGAKMIRSIMKQKSISTLEELMQNAINHGVRIIACQMSMDIMGIHKEELIDGVELGGVSTFLGSAEQSDMSLFI